MRHLRLSVVLLLAVGVLMMSLGTTASAGPPKIGQSNSAWTGAFWPPPIAAPGEPAFVKATRTTIARTWNGMQRSTRSAWEKTKYALRPYDPPSKRERAQAKRGGGQGGFWSQWFGGGEPQNEELTVNDFLRQPTPR